MSVMKRMFLAVAVMLSLSSFASATNLGEEINNKSIIDLQEVELAEDGSDFVSVKFKINNDKIEVLSIQGTQEVLEEKVQNKLESLNIDSYYLNDVPYVVKFSFLKE